MRHGKKVNHLGRTASHRSAMLSNMASSLILSKRITTTLAKAKALRTYVEPLLTKAKDDSTNSRRVVFSYLQNKETVTILFRDIATKIADRPGGYTRIIKTGTRQGDNAEMCFIELVDYNELMLKDTTSAKAKATTRRGGKKKAEDTAPAAKAPKAAAPIAATEVEETEVEEVSPAVEETPATEDTNNEAEDEAKA